jgi:pimeloyl-ACP methyl ester carboxylesterase
MSAAIEQGQYAQLSNGMRLHFASAGTRGRPLMLFVHGFPEAWFEWQHQLQEFGAEYFAVAPDLRGFNLSGKPLGVEHYRPKLVVDDLRLLVAHLGYSEGYVVAHDWGGAIAWNLAIFLPQLVRRLVIINAPHPYLFMRDLATDPGQQQASAYMNWLRAEGSEGALAKDDFALLDSLFSKGKKGDQSAPHWYTPEVRARYHAMWSVPGAAGSAALAGSVNYYRASPLRPPVAGESATAFDGASKADWMVRVPVRVIWGDEDAALRTNLLNGLEELCADLQITRIPEGSHWVIHEQPERINGLIRAALTN